MAEEALCGLFWSTEAERVQRSGEDRLAQGSAEGGSGESALGWEGPVCPVEAPPIGDLRPLLFGE